MTATVKGTALTAALNLGPARTDADTIPSTVVNWERSTDGGTNWVDVRTADVGVPIDGDTVNNETYLLRVTINFPWGIDNNAGNSFGRITVDPSTGDPIADPYQWTLEDAQLVLTQTGPNAPTP